jgi:hypothetical protein
MTAISRLTGIAGSVSCPSAHQSVEQNLAFVIVEYLAVPKKAKKTGQDGLEAAGGHAAVLGHCDEFGERRQPGTRSAGKVRIDPIADERDRALKVLTRHNAARRCA